MPYTIVRQDGEYCVEKEGDGEIMGCHGTREDAVNQIAAIEASEAEDKAEGYKPTSGMVEEARKGLEWREEYGRGGTRVGVARARDISNGRNLSEDTVKRMFSFFSRHEESSKGGQGFSPGEEGYPSAGRIAWALWGGDAGFSWSRKLTERFNREEDKNMDKAAPDALSRGDFVSWDSSGGRSQGRITRIERDGSIDVPDSSFTINGEPDDPAALITVYQEGEDGWEPTDTQVGHRFSTLTKIDALKLDVEAFEYVVKTISVINKGINMVNENNDNIEQEIKNFLNTLEMESR